MKNIYLRFVVLSSFTLLLFSGLMAQNNDDSVDQIIADLISAMVENSEGEGEFDFNTLYEKYEILQERPINLNSADRSDLQEIFFLSDIQISNLLDHIDKLGDLRSIYELQTIPGFSITTIRLLSQITTVKKKVTVSRQSIRSTLNAADHTVFLKWKRFVETQRGFKSVNGNDPNFLGSPDHLYLRYKMNVGNDIKMGFIAEKDAGEPFYYPNKIYGADYFSFHVYARDITERIRFIALGDYSINFGQGLVMHNGFGAGKSSLTTGIRKGGYPIRAYSSVAELNFLRGAATTLRLGKKIEWTAFVSSRFRNGNIELDPDDPFLGSNVGSLPLGGLNRTESEIAKKNRIRQNTIGTSLKYKLRKGHIAFNGIYDRFNATLVPAALYQKFYPTGQSLWNVSTDYGYNFRNLNFFGEVAMANNLAVAQMHGLLIGLDKRLDLVMSYRNYGRGYRSLTANAFGESAVGSNEEGLYLGLEFRPTKGWLINAYADYWKNPWLRFRVDAPGYGNEYFLKVLYFKKRTWDLYAQYFYENKLRNLDGQVDAPVANLRQRLRLHGSIKLSKAYTLRNRVEFAWYDDSEYLFDGFLVYQDILYKPVAKNYSFNMRYALFDIQDYDSRIYAYENDILNEYYIPAYSGRGIRFYINGKLRINRHVRFEARYEVTKLSQAFNDEDGDITNDGFGSGNSLIVGRVRSQVKAQIRYKF